MSNPSEYNPIDDRYNDPSVRYNDPLDMDHLVPTKYLHEIIDSKLDSISPYNPMTDDRGNQPSPRPVRPPHRSNPTGLVTGTATAFDRLMATARAANTPPLTPPSPIAAWVGRHRKAIAASLIGIPLAGTGAGAGIMAGIESTHELGSRLCPETSVVGVGPITPKLQDAIDSLKTFGTVRIRLVDSSAKRDGVTDNMDVDNSLATMMGCNDAMQDVAVYVSKTPGLGGIGYEGDAFADVSGEEVDGINSSMRHELLSNPDATAQDIATTALVRFRADTLSPEPSFGENVGANLRSLEEHAQNLVMDFAPYSMPSGGFTAVTLAGASIRRRRRYNSINAKAIDGVAEIVESHTGKLRAAIGVYDDFFLNKLTGPEQLTADASPTLVPLLDIRRNLENAISKTRQLSTRLSPPADSNSLRRRVWPDIGDANERLADRRKALKAVNKGIDEVLKTADSELVACDTIHDNAEAYQEMAVASVKGRSFSADTNVILGKLASDAKDAVFDGRKFTAALLYKTIVETAAQNKSPRTKR